MAFAAPAVDFNYFLQRKYALQQQEADATTQNAGSSRIQADANALVANAQAKQTNVQTGLMPAESASGNALRAAQARLAGVQADVLPAESRANIGLTLANTALAGTNNDVIRRQKLTNIMTGGALPFAGSALGPALGGVMGPSGFRFTPAPSVAPARRQGETQAQYMDRTGWGL